MNSTIIDTHVHLWRYNRKDFPWITPDIDALAQDFLFDDLLVAKESADVEQVVLVQARQLKEETQFLCSIAENNHDVLGVVGWVDVLGDLVEQELIAYKQTSSKTKLVAFRHLVQDELNENFMCQPKFIQAMKLLNKHQFSYEVLIKRHQFGQFHTLLQELSEHESPNYVLDHMGKPAINGISRDFELWRKDITKVACYPNVYCKISGLLTESSKNTVEKEDFRPCIDTIIEKFGVDRIMLGSDWPVCTIKGTYEESMNVATYLKKELIQSYWNAIAKLTAQRVYGQH